MYDEETTLDDENTKKTNLKEKLVSVKKKFVVPKTFQNQVLMTECVRGNKLKTVALLRSCLRGANKTAHFLSTYIKDFLKTVLCAKEFSKSFTKGLEDGCQAHSKYSEEAAAWIHYYIFYASQKKLYQMFDDRHKFSVCECGKVWTTRSCENLVSIENAAKNNGSATRTPHYRRFSC
eukprot:Platyproteum_vivax@DN2885_c0_g1_i1.p2